MAGYLNYWFDFTNFWVEMMVNDACVFVNSKYVLLFCIVNVVHIGVPLYFWVEEDYSTPVRLR